MVRLDGDAYVEPLSSDLPCGPDLERALDLDFTALVVDAEGLLPRSFFAFQRDSKVLRERRGAIIDLSSRTRDLRLLVPYAKFSILDRDLVEFVHALEVVASVLETRWEDVHPQAEDGDLGLRAAVISGLDDMPNVIMPLQHVVLLHHRALGDITFRSVQLARRIIAAREGESVPELPVLERAFERADLEQLSAVRKLFLAVAAAVARIEAACDDKPGMPPLALPKLSHLASEAAAFLAPYMRLGMPADEAAPSSQEGGDRPEENAPAADASGAAGHDLLKDRAGAAAALAGIERYFRRYEPSSPALVLIRFAGRLMDRPFFEVLQLIVPDQASVAELMIGGSAIRVSLERIAADMEALDRSDCEVSEPVPPPVLETRRDAVRLMGDLARHLRCAEPANPVPLLLDRAADLAGRDFSSLLKDMFSDAALRAMKGDEA